MKCENKNTISLLLLLILVILLLLIIIITTTITFSNMEFYLSHIDKTRREIKQERKKKNKINK
jgi:flagellar biosynthesis protein FlhB